MANPLEQKDLSWINQRDPGRLATADYALVWASRGEISLPGTGGGGAGGNVVGSVAGSVSVQGSLVYTAPPTPLAITTGSFFFSGFEEGKTTNTIFGGTGTGSFTTGNARAKGPGTSYKSISRAGGLVQGDFGNLQIGAFGSTGAATFGRVYWRVDTNLTYSSTVTSAGTELDSIDIFALSDGSRHSDFRMLWKYVNHNFVSLTFGVSDGGTPEDTGVSIVKGKWYRIEWTIPAGGLGANFASYTIYDEDNSTPLGSHTSAGNKLSSALQSMVFGNTTTPGNSDATFKVDEQLDDVAVSFTGALGAGAVYTSLPISNVATQWSPGDFTKVNNFTLGTGNVCAADGVTRVDRFDFADFTSFPSGWTLKKLMIDGNRTLGSGGVNLIQLMWFGNTLYNGVSITSGNGQFFPTKNTTITWTGLTASQSTFFNFGYSGVNSVSATTMKLLYMNADIEP